MSFPRYPKYKDSGVEWLGNVPEHWKVKRLRFVAELNPSKSEINHLRRETTVTFLPMEAIGDDGILSLEKEKTIGEVESGYTYFRDGDVTIAKITPCYENGKGALMCGLLNSIGFGTTELIVARTRPDEIIGIYLHLLFISKDFRSLGESHMYGAGGQKRVPDDFVRNFKTAFPPVAEQAVIASFLDRETEKIDALVAEQRRLIELLKEKRQAVISHAVTKGLNPHAPMKPSGVEWLGEVPEHWEVGRVKNYFRTCSGGTPNTAQQVLYYTDEENGIPWVRTTDLQNEVLRTVEVFITERALADTACSVLPMGTIMVAMYGGDGTVGKNGLLAIPAAINQAVCGLLPSTTHRSEYAFRFMQFYRPYWMIGAESSRKDPNISQERVQKAPFPKPPRDEQDSIVNFLEIQLKKFDTLTAEAQHAIDLLQERRTALISAAVTGKIDVRGVV